ncbi:MAG TPA: hypothetical protein VFF70_07675 [Anaerolineae bacterium]|nr:hypothetical protein [Anaerolineae bacterium]
MLRATKAVPGAWTDEITSLPTAQQAVEKLTLKFSNGLRIYGLLPGEKLEDLVFQSGDWKRWLFLFRRPVLANTLLLLSSNYTVVIREELEVAQGWIISYIPRSSIVGIQNQPRSLWKELTVQLNRGDQTAEYKLRLTDEAAQAWREQWIQHGGQWQDLPDDA